MKPVVKKFIIEKNARNITVGREEAVYQAKSIYRKRGRANGEQTF